MKLSLEWLRDYVDLTPSLTVKQLAHDLTMTTVEVEGAIDIGAALANVVIGEIVSLDASARPGLAVAHCNVGARRLQVLSAARNLRVGMKVAVALPGAVVNHGGAPLSIEPRQISGLQSEGMMCSPGELGLEALFANTPADGILDLAEVPGAPGDAFAPAIGWNDIVLEIDNKSLTNRPDLWGHHGIARELSAIYGLPLRALPDWQPSAPAERLVDASFDLTQCRRFAAARIVNARMQSSPFWLRSRLARIGQQPRNLYVDLTNYVMFATGQPCHAYDASKLTLPLTVRKSIPGSAIKLLDGRDYTLDGATLVIHDADKPVGLAGVMGDGHTAVSDHTESLLLEMANFDPLAIRRAATRLGLRTEASSRFEKNIDTYRIGPSMALFIELLAKCQPTARVVGIADAHRAPTRSLGLEASVSFLQERLGEAMDGREMAQRLRSVGFEVRERSGDLFEVSVPAWRATGDVSSVYDLLEEVARLRGYENIAFVAPQIQLTRAAINQCHIFRRRLREVLALSGGMQEVVTYPWVRELMLDAAGVSAAAPMRLSAGPAPDESRLRPSLLPGILESVVTNLRYFDDFRVFEIGRVFTQLRPDLQSAPSERPATTPSHVAGALVGTDMQQLITEAKGVLDRLADANHFARFTFTQRVGPAWADAQGCLHVSSGEHELGWLGVLSGRTRRIADIKHAVVVAFELDLDALEKLASVAAYRALPEYPESTADLSMVFANQVTWDSIAATVRNLHPLLLEVLFIDMFHGGAIPPDRKSVTLRLRLGSATRTLRSEEVMEVSQLVAGKLTATFGAQLRA
jgi:phenylalanyl-tRNA synthetase beta chain